MRPKRILIAEDEIGSRELITIHAENNGYEVIAVSDGIDLLTASVNERFDLIITDLMMADLNGASATEILKMNGNTVPVIAVTALREEYVQQVKDKFVKVFHKPCNYKELFLYVEFLIGK